MEVNKDSERTTVATDTPLTNDQDNSSKWACSIAERQEKIASGDLILRRDQPGGRVPLEKRWEAGRGEVGGSPHTRAEEADSGSHYAAGWQRLGRSALGPTHFA